MEFLQIGSEWESAMNKKTKPELIELLRKELNNKSNFLNSLPTPTTVQNISISLPGLSLFSNELLSDGYRKGIIYSLDFIFESFTND